MVGNQSQKTGLQFLITAVLTTIILLVGTREGRVTAEFTQPPPANTPEGWQVECIDCPRYFTGMSGNSAALDSGGLIHTTYGGDGLYYAVQNPDNTYTTEVVDPNPRRGLNATMALDSSDRPHILYYAGDLLRLNYAFFDGANWQITSLPTGDLTTLPHPWLAIDSSDNLHLAFIEGDSLVYGFYDLINWSFTTVDTDTNGNIGRPSLDLDSSDQPHIAYGRGGKYAYFDGANWQITTFAGTYDYGESIALALDQNGRPHIVFQSSAVDYPLWLWYRYFDGTDWQLEEVEHSNGSHLGDAYDLSLTLDDTNQPILTYSLWLYYFEPGLEYRYYEVRVSHRNQSGSWPSFVPSQYLPKRDSHYSTIIPGPGTNWTLVYKDSPYIETAVYDTVQAYFTGVVEYGGSSATHIDMAMDNEDGLHVSGHRADDSGLKYFRKEQGIWSSLLLNEAGLESNEWTSIAVTNDERPYLMWQSWDRVTTRTYYTYFDGQAWQTAYDGRNFASYQAGRDSQNRFHYAGTNDSYCPYDSCLSHNRIDPDGSWDPSTVDRNQVYSGHVDIAIDTADFPHIAYPASDGLRYAVQTPSGWYTETAASGFLVDYPSLALDRFGRPHIAWYDALTKDLHYANFDGVDWQTLTLDNSGDVGQYASLAVDRLGRIYIAYYDATNLDLKYAAYDGNSWTIESLLGDGDVGSFSKLVMPYAGYPAIAYYDDTARDLLLIYRPFSPENHAYLPVFFD